MAFLVLKAPEVAITQLVVEILVLIILIRSTIRKDLPFSTSGRWFLNTASWSSSSSPFLGAISLALRDLPTFGYPIMRVASDYLRDGFAQTGATNLVAAVVLNYRAYDRLGEVTVLLHGLHCRANVVRRSGRVGSGGLGGRGGGMNPRGLIKAFHSLCTYRPLRGEDDADLRPLYHLARSNYPRDGFAGGVMIALAFIMHMLVFGKDVTLRIFTRPAASAWPA